MFIAVAAFVGVLAIVVGAYWLFILRPEGAAERALGRRLSPAGPVRPVERTSLLKRVAPLSTFSALETILARSSALVRPLERLIERSGLRMTVGQLVLGSLLTGSLAGFAVLQLTANGWIALGTSCMTAAVPWAIVRYSAQRRMGKFEEQFPEAIDLIARALRAGHALTMALGMVADEVAEPARSEFKLLHDRQNYGMPFAEAMRSFAERIPLLDARFFATAVLTQREAGGNLAEVLDSLAVVIRDRFKLKRQVRVLSAHGRITGWILGALPFVIGGALFVIAPDHISILFTDSIGLQIVGVAVVLQVIGVIAIRRIVNIEI